MRHYNFGDQFRALYDKAVKLYGSGRRGAGSFFTAEEQAFLTRNGLTAQAMYDYAEDQDNSGEPGYDRALAIELVRRDYFLNQQRSRHSATVLDEAKMPSKDDAVQGIAWLPRLIPKARAKLRGELPASLMYCCGGDRRFFQAHDIHPAEFLGVVWRNGNDDAAIIDWVAARDREASRPAEAAAVAGRR